MRIQVYFFITALLSLISHSAYSAEEDAILAAIKSINYISKHEQDVWPNFKIDTIPIFIYFENNEHSYAYHFKPKNKQWKQLTIDNTPIFFMGNDAFNFKNSLEDFQTIDGNLSYIFNFVDYESEYSIHFSIRNLINRRFSFYLTKESKFPKNMFAHWDTEYSGFNEMANVEYIYLEAEELKSFLSKKNIESLKNYLAIHHLRHSIINKNSAAYEKIAEIRFGMGAYVGYKALNLNEDKYLQEVLSTYQKNLMCPSYETLQQIEYCTSLAHYYLTGPSLGYALDKAQGNTWKSEIDNYGVTPQALLEKVYPMNDNEITQRIEQSKKIHHFEIIKQKIETKMKYYLSEMQSQQANYTKESGIKINIDYRYCKPTKYTDKFREEFVISNRQTLYTYYNMLLECNNNGSKITLEFKEIPFLIKVDSILNARFKASFDTKLTIDGKIQPIKNINTPNTKINFTNLKIENKYVNLKISGKGSINQSGDVVIISP